MKRRSIVVVCSWSYVHEGFKRRLQRRCVGESVTFHSLPPTLSTQSIDILQSHTNSSQSQRHFSLRTQTIFTWWLILRPGRGAEYCVQPVCLFVCLSVCLSASISLKSLDQSSRNFACRSPVVVARSSSGGIVLRYVLPVLWMTSRLAVMGARPARVVSTQRWQSLGRPGRSLMSTNACLMY